MKKRFVVLASCILLVFLFTGYAVAADSFSSAVFDPGDPHELTISKSAGGTASGAGTKLEGADVTVIATPADGYVFVGWTGSGVPGSTSATYTFTMPAIDCSLYAEFAPVSYALSITKTTGGNASGAGSFVAGAEVTVTATPSAGYTFVRWDGSGISGSTSATYGFTMPANNCSLNAVFTPVLYPLSITKTVGGNASGAGSFATGTEVTVSATPNAGYDFIRWEASGSTVSTSAVYKFSMPTSAYSLNAVFAAKPPTPTVKPTVTPTPKVTPTVAPTPVTEPTTVPSETTETTVAPTETTVPAETTAPAETIAPTPTPTPSPAAGVTKDDSDGNSKKGLGLIVLIGVVLFMVIGATIAGFIEEYKGRKKIVIRKPSDNPTNNYRY